MRIIIHDVRSERGAQDPGVIDMTPDGAFRTPPAAPWSARVLRYALAVAVVAAGLAVAALMLWFALILIPVALGAALVAYLAFRWRMWQARRGGVHGR